MSLERTFQGPMKWVPSQAPNGQGGVNAAAPVSPTPSYATASSTSAPSTPASYSDHHSALHSMSPNPWSSPLMSQMPSYYPHHLEVASPGNVSAASSAITNRSGYEGDHDEDPARFLGSRPSSSSSSLSSSSSAHRGRGGQVRPSNSVGGADTVTTARAMRLLEDAVDQQASLVVAPRGKKGARQCASQLKALNLFDEQYSGEANADTVRPTQAAAGAGLDDCKSDIDKIRQKGAGMRALNLLNDTVAGEKHKVQQQGATSAERALTARRAAQLAYKIKQEEKAKVQAKLKRDLEMYGRRVPKLVVPARSEALAESSRPKKPATDEDVRDPETISGMKCQLYWDREKEAQARALKLLNDDSAAIMTIL